MSDYIERLEAMETVARLHDPDVNILSYVYGGNPTEEARRDAFAQDLRSLLSDVERMRGAILTITYRDRDGSVCNSFVEDCDLRKYAPALDEIHPPRQALSAPNTEEGE